MQDKVILSIDGSLTSSGVAILNGDNGEVIAYDNIPIKPKDYQGEEILKIHHIAKVILELAINYKVTHVAIENSFVGVNSRTGLTLARLFGGITTLLIENGFNLIYKYTPSQWRKIAMNVGNKSKEGTHKWVCENMVDLGEFSAKGKNKNDDIADALCMGYALYKEINKL